MNVLSARRTSVPLIAASVVAIGLTAGGPGIASAAPGDVEYVSVTPDGNASGPAGAYLLDLSGDGGTVLFWGQPASPPGAFQATYLRRNGVTTQVGPTTSSGPLITGGLSDNGRWLAYQDDPGDGTSILRLRDLSTDSTTSLATPIGTTRAAVGNCGRRLDVSDDGGVIAFSTTTSLVPADDNTWCDVYLWNPGGSGQVLLASTPGAASVNGRGSRLAALNPAGTRLLYLSDVDSSVAASAGNDLWLTQADGSRSLESVDNNGSPLGTGVTSADFTDDASKVVFASYSDPTGQFADNMVTDVYLRDRGTGVAIHTTGPLPFAFSPTISGDGKYLAAELYWTPARNFASMAVYDVADSTWQLASHRAGDPSGESDSQSSDGMISADASTVVFSSYARNLVAPAFTGDVPGLWRYQTVGLANPDVDGDGIEDSVDGALPGQYADAYVFGTILQQPTGVTIAVTDEPDPEGVRLVATGGPGTVRIRHCGVVTLSFTPPVDLILTCGSAITKVIAGGPVDAELDATTSVSIPNGARVEIDDAATGGYTVDVLEAPALAGESVTLVNGDATRTIAVDDPVVTAQTWTFTGFAQPVDNGAVVNVIKGGQAVPLKWRITQAGAPVTTLTTAKVTFPLGCSTTGSEDAIEQTTTDASGLLKNLGNGYYQYNWKTPRAPGACGNMLLDIGDGVLHSAAFRLK